MTETVRTDLPEAPRAQRRRRKPRSRVDFSASAQLAARVERQGLKTGGALADAAKCFHRREQAAKAARKAAKQARKAARSR